MSNYQIETMSREMLDFAVDLAAGEGWNPGCHDADAFYAADPQGFMVGKLDGQPIGCISAVAYPDAFGFIGFYIIVPEFRGQGYGIQLWNKAMEKLAGKNIGLDGVIEQQPNYKKSGFKLAYSNIRFERIIEQKPNLDYQNLIPLSGIDFQSVADYDRRFFPSERQSFLKAWLELPESKQWACVENGELTGYGVIRNCRKGYKIGPLFADRAEIADQLFNALCSYADVGEPVYLDVPEVNQDGLALAERYAMKKVFGTARMYTGDFPGLDLDHTFGVTTFELG